jgi:hypothetical protein
VHLGLLLKIPSAMKLGAVAHFARKSFFNHTCVLWWLMTLFCSHMSDCSQLLSTRQALSGSGENSRKVIIWPSYTLLCFIRVLQWTILVTAKELSQSLFAINGIRADRFLKHNSVSFTNKIPFTNKSGQR